MKLRMTRTMVAEFDYHPEYYPEGTTIADAGQMDCDNIDGWEDIFGCELLKDEVSFKAIDDKGMIIATGKRACS